MEKKIVIDPQKKIGPIRPMNGVGGGPVTKNFNVCAIQEFADANIPYSRLHDIEYPFGAGEYVDIHCVFPDFEKDVDDPASYNFVFTDEYLKNIVASGAKPFYRLGTTIEHQPIKRYIYPPKDYLKWAQICSHLIDHYNCGWADGFHMGIEYWEIWNEPDLKDRCWVGDDDSFFRLYNVASKFLKKNHPEVKIGGCAVTNASTEYADHFLSYVQDVGAPLDFFSWHHYMHTPEDARKEATHALELLKKYGFENTESICDEWNYVVSWSDTIQRSINLHKTSFNAAFLAAVMSEFHKVGLDVSCFYEAQMSDNWCSLFTKSPMKDHGFACGVICEPPYYALKAWGDLRRIGTEVAVEETQDVFVTAACDGKKLGVLISYYNDDGEFNQAPPSDATITLNLSGVSFGSHLAYVTDEEGKIGLYHLMVLHFSCMEIPWLTLNMSSFKEALKDAS